MASRRRRFPRGSWHAFTFHDYYLHGYHYQQSRLQHSTLCPITIISIPSTVIRRWFSGDMKTEPLATGVSSAVFVLFFEIFPVYLFIIDCFPVVINGEWGTPLLQLTSNWWIQLTDSIGRCCCTDNKELEPSSGGHFEFSRQPIRGLQTNPNRKICNKRKKPKKKVSKKKKRKIKRERMNYFQGSSSTSSSTSQLWWTKRNRWALKASGYETITIKPHSIFFP